MALSKESQRRVVQDAIQDRRTGSYRNYAEDRKEDLRKEHPVAQALDLVEAPLRGIFGVTHSGTDQTKQDMYDNIRLKHG